MGILDALRPKWKHSDPDVRLEAIQQIDDPLLLLEIAARDGEWFVRHGAFDALRAMKPEQKLFNDLVRTAKDEEVRRKTVKVMLDEEALEWVAKNDKFRYVRDAAEHRLEELRKDTWGEKSGASTP